LGLFLSPRMSRVLENTFLKKKAPALLVHIIDEYDIAETSVLDKFFATRDKIGVGVAASYFDYRIQILALATSRQVLLVDLSGYEGEQVAASRRLLTRWLTEENILFMGFNLARLFLALFADTQLRISNAFDFESLEKENVDEKRDHLFQSVQKKFDSDLRSREKEKQLIKIFQSEDYEEDRGYEAVAVRAWLAIYAGNKFDAEKLYPVINVDSLSTEVCRCMFYSYILLIS
jgi:hypothetical protein